ncbi:hypothetical protein [Epilithonimonas zeae]|uniref:hypothetical protein n=1 Tax=Epilithonimonas zeae TaxID=1416779 RepID=UPI0020103B9D|nr:hypothetical protein [Epilithonimonas zeae]UQB68580.1 hypothetical protein KI430_16420 [Epilithonimonas zeae]
MKNLYIAILMIAGTSFAMAQESKTTEEKQEIPKEVTEANAKAYKDKAAEKKVERTGLASEEGLQKSKTQNKASAPSGKTIPGTSDIYAVKASIPGRTVNNKKQVSNKKQVQGLPNTATLAEIKKTIPKN